MNDSTLSLDLNTSLYTYLFHYKAKKVSAAAAAVAAAVVCIVDPEEIAPAIVPFGDFVDVDLGAFVLLGGHTGADRSLCLNVHLLTEHAIGMQNPVRVDCCF